MRGKTEEVAPALFLNARNGNITRIELDILLAIGRTLSQNKAAAELGISVPVLNKRLAGISKKAGVPVIETTSLHTRLSEAGKRLVATYVMAEARLQDLGRPVIGASMLVEPYLRQMMDERVHLCTSTDDFNLAAFKMGLLDIAIIDDPEIVMTLSWGEHSHLVEEMVEVGRDELLHWNRGQRYIRFAYGAQGMGFRYLQQSGVRFEIKETTMNPPRLFACGLSFFLNRRIYESASFNGNSTNKVADMRSLEGSQKLMHTITAVVHKKQGRTEAEAFLLEQLLHDLKANFSDTHHKKL